jgi:hypothetical protein
MVSSTDNFRNVYECVENWQFSKPVKSGHFSKKCKYDDNYDNNNYNNYITYLFLEV